MNYKIVLFSLLFIHQFFYSTAVSDSFSSPKWFFIVASIGIFLLYYCLFSGNFSGVQKKERGSLSAYSIVFCLVCFLFIPAFSDLGHGNFYGIIYSLGVPSLFLAFLIFFRHYQIDFSGFGFFLSLFSCLVVFSEYLDLNPFFQGGKYHLSAFTGNPNIIAAVLLFWYWPGLEYLRRKGQKRFYSKIFSGLVFLALVLTFSRAALLVFILLNIFFYGREIFVGIRFWFLSLFVVSVVFVFMFFNPSGISGFSHYGIRAMELKQSLKIISVSPLFGSGRHNYRAVYWKSLEGAGFSPLSRETKPSDEVRHIRLSDESHFSFLWPFLSFGLPLGVLWLLAFLFLLRISCAGLNRCDKYALGSILLCAQVYYLFYFSLILLPFLLFFVRGLAAKGVGFGFQAEKRLMFLCLIMIFIWAFFCAGEFRHLYLRETAKTEQDFKRQLTSFFADGEDYYRYAFFLSRRAEPGAADLMFELLEEAYSRKPDAAYFYYRALAFQRQGELDLARSELERGLGILPTNASLYYARALLSEDISEQIYNYRLALSMRYDYFRAWNNLAICYFEEAERIKSGVGDKEEILGLYRDSLSAFEKAIFYASGEDKDYMDGLQIKYRTVLSLLRQAEGSG